MGWLLLANYSIKLINPPLGIKTTKMKKVILLLAVLLTAIGVFAQTSQTIDASVFDAIYNWIIGYIPVKTLTIILTVGWILEYVITYVKWTPANSTLALVWNGFKKIIEFIANKKTI